MTIISQADLDVDFSTAFTLPRGNKSLFLFLFLFPNPCILSSQTAKGPALPSLLIQGPRYLRHSDSVTTPPNLYIQSPLRWAQAGIVKKEESRTGGLTLLDEQPVKRCDLVPFLIRSVATQNFYLPSSHDNIHNYQFNPVSLWLRLPRIRTINSNALNLSLPRL